MRSRLPVHALVALMVLPAGVSAENPSPPKNIRVNDPSTDRFPNITQLEPSLAVFGSNVVVGWNDSGHSQGKRNGLGFALGYGFSSDGGATFTDAGALDGGGINGSNWGADATLAVDRAGNFYFGRFAFISSSPNTGTTAGVTVHKSTDGGATFRQTLPPFRSSGGSDKPFLTVDNTGGPRDGTIYVTWTNTGGDLTIMLSRSTDGGATFSSPIAVSPTTGLHQYAMPAIGPNGEVFVTWYELDTDRIFLRKSVDGGATFGPTALVIAVDQIGSASICSKTSRSGLKGDIRASNIPIIAVDTTSGPSRGNVYIVIASAPVVGGRDMADVYLLRSTDGGATWDSPRRLNDDATTNDQWLPFVTVAPSGVVGTMWYDRRLDSNNLLIDVFMSVSADGGSSFGPNFRITDVSFPVPQLNPNFDPLAASDCYMGSYNFMVADANSFYLAWTDNRLIASGVPDPNIFFAKVLIDIELGPPAIVTRPRHSHVLLPR